MGSDSGVIHIVFVLFLHSMSQHFIYSLQQGRGRQSSSSALFTANGGTGGGIALKLDAALDYSWSLSLVSSGYSSACSSMGYSSSFSPPPETYSRKVFVGGLPTDIDQGELQNQALELLQIGL